MYYIRNMYHYSLSEFTPYSLMSRSMQTVFWSLVTGPLSCFTPWTVRRAARWSAGVYRIHTGVLYLLSACIHGMVDVCLVCGEIKTQLPCPANVSDLWRCMRTDTANISYRNLICNEGRGKYYHYITQQLEHGPTLTAVSVVSYLVICNSEGVFYFLHF